MTVPADIVLAVPLAARLRAECDRAAPHECCGLLIGRRIDGSVHLDDMVVSENLSAVPERAFEIDAGLHLTLQRDLRGTDRSIVGLYHSHPEGQAFPSETDRAMAWQPDMVWLIGARNDTGWYLNGFFWSGSGADFTRLNLKENLSS